MLLQSQNPSNINNIGEQSKLQMGNKLKQISYIAKNATSTIGHSSTCPNCEQEFPPTTTYQYFDQHVTYCLENFRPTDQERLRMQRRKKSTGSQSDGTTDANLPINQDYITIQVYIRKIDTSQIEQHKQKANNQQRKHPSISASSKNNRKTLQQNNKFQKEEKNNQQQNRGELKTRLAYRWVKSQLTYSESLLNELSLAQISKQSSAYKILWFYHKLCNYRITWKEGAEELTFHPESIVKDSLPLIQLNMYKQLKLKVVNDIVHDAGGLLREWATMLLSQLIHHFHLLIRNNQGYYVLNTKYCGKDKLNQIVNLSINNTNNNNRNTSNSNNNNSNNNSNDVNKNKIQQSQQKVAAFSQSQFADMTEQQYQLYQNYYLSHMLNYKSAQLISGKQMDCNKVTYGDLYRLLARLLSKVLIDKVTIPIHFDYLFINNLIRRTNSPQNLTSSKDQSQNMLNMIYTYDKQLYQSLQYLHELYHRLSSTIASEQEYKSNVQELQALSLTFTVPANATLKEHQLKPKGSSIPVSTKDQLKEYLQRIQKYYIYELFANQFKIIKQQLYTVIKPNIFDGLLECQQFELLINGVDGESINVKDWQSGTQYRQPYSSQHKVIKYFWNAVNKMSNIEKMRLLKFVTGSERLPIFGFKNLQTNRGDTSHFVIQGVKYDKKKSYLPKAHTCFNRLILPIYPNEQLLHQNLLAVVRANFDGIWGME